MDGRTVTVLSGKGGSGKTLFAVNLGTALALSGSRVLLMDLNPGYRNIDFCVGMQNEIVYDIEDVLNNICRIKQAVLKVNSIENLSIMSCSQKVGKSSFRPEMLSKLLEILKKTFDYIIIDTHTGVNTITASVLPYTDTAVIITTPEYASVRACCTVNEIIRDAGITDTYLIVNRIREGCEDEEGFPSFTELTESLRMEVTGVLYEDEELMVSHNSGHPAAAGEDKAVFEFFESIIERMAV